MISRVARLGWPVALIGFGFLLALGTVYATNAPDPKPPRLASQVVGWADANSHVADWGEMRRYFTGESFGTKNVLVAVAVVQPGKAVHRAHRHGPEEYLLLVEGVGTWSLDGKEFPAKRGDILYVHPWIYHGLTNTSEKPLTFAVIRYNSKGIEIPPRPDDRPDEL
jgi:mannose-6-phosphate isomerase-like protein (cupin superfamily)